MSPLNLTVCAGVHPALYEPHLAAWASAGLISGVASCSLQSLSGSFAEADCRFADGTSWLESRLDEVLRRERYETVTLVVLRTDGLSADPRLIQLEAGALDAMRRKFLAVDVRLRAVTVAVARPGAAFAQEAFSPMWDLHLLHDSRILADAHSPYLSLTEDDAPGLCALTALCAGGSWSFSDEPWIADEQIDRVVKPVRLVRPQLRIVLAEKFDVEEASGLVFTSSPWPEPSDLDTQRSNPGVFPPMSFVRPLAEGCRFVCAPSAPDPEETDVAWRRMISLKGGRFVKAVKALFAPLEPPSPTNDVEQALETFDSLRQDDAASTVNSLRLAGMPGLATGLRATPKTWEFMRQALYGLVDGSEMPAGVRRPPPTPGSDQDQRLIWCDPSMVAPSPDAEPFNLPPMAAAELGVEKVDALDAALCRRVQRFIDKEEERRRAREERLAQGEEDAEDEAAWDEAAAGEDGDADDIDERQFGFSQTSRTPVEVDEADETSRSSQVGSEIDSDSDDPFAAYRPEDDEADDDELFARQVLSEAHRRAEDAEANDETAGGLALDSFKRSWGDWLSRWRWTPLWGLADHLANALETAAANFALKKSRCHSQKEYEYAVSSKRKFKRVLILIGIAAVIGGLVILERHLGLLGNLFQIGVRTDSLVDFYLFIGLVGLGVAALGYFSKEAALDSLDYVEAEEERLERSKDAQVSALELTRLHTASVEFDDHQKVIRRMLHEPFGRFVRTPRKSLEALEEEHVPASMLIALAQVRSDRMEEICLRMRSEIFRQGWVAAAHEQAERFWSRHYEQKVNDEFPLPDEDNGPAGAARYRDVLTGAALPGPREHFRESVDSYGLSLQAGFVNTAMREHFRESANSYGVGVDVRNEAARLRAADAFENVPSRMEMLTLVHVLRVPAMTSVSVEEFLELHSGSKDTFDAALLSPVASPFAHGQSREDSLDFSAPVRLSGGMGKAFDLWASWRMAVSGPIPPSHLTGWQEPPEEPVAPPTLV